MIEFFNKYRAWILIGLVAVGIGVLFLTNYNYADMPELAWSLIAGAVGGIAREIIKVASKYKSQGIKSYAIAVVLILVPILYQAGVNIPEDILKVGIKALFGGEFASIWNALEKLKS